MLSELIISLLLLLPFSLTHFNQASEPTTPLRQLVMITNDLHIAKMCQNGKFSMLVLTSQQHLTQLIDLPSFSKHFLHLPARTSLSTGILPALLAAPLLIPSHISSPTLELSAGPLPVYTHYLNDLIQSHSINYQANADEPQNPVSNPTSSLTPDSLSNCLLNFPIWISKKHF